jgi:threonylcarbamoyladenosine tRNA methylthiotransferase MtaB
MPHASIGTDVIVGFPGEDAGCFEQLREAVARLPFTYVHVFPYSDRPGTDASSRDAKVAGLEIRERGAAIRAVAAQKVAAFRAAQIGTTRRALTVNDGLSAVTDNYLKVQLPAPYPRNEWVSVTIS